MHHEAQTFRIQTLPRMSSAEKVFEGSFSCGRRNVGAALLISGDGTSCGSRVNPTARKTTRTRKSASGIKYLSISCPLSAAPAYLCVLCVKFKRRDRRDTQRNTTIPLVLKRRRCSGLPPTSVFSWLHVPC